MTASDYEAIANMLAYSIVASAFIGAFTALELKWLLDWGMRAMCRQGRKMMTRIRESERYQRHKAEYEERKRLEAASPEKGNG